MTMRLIFLLLALPAFSCAATAKDADGTAAAPDAGRLARFKPFRNESDQIVLGDLVVENRLDRIELYGSLAITRDKAGLELAQAVRRLIDATIGAMQAGTLPDRIRLKPTDSVASPFAPD
jgi:hypothetical protein